MTLGTENRPQASSGLNVQNNLKQLLKQNVMSFDFAPRDNGNSNPKVKHIFYNKNTEYPLYAMGRVGVAYDVDGSGTSAMDYTYELSDHLGNVRVVVEDGGKVMTSSTKIYDLKDHLGNVRARFSNQTTPSNVVSYFFTSSSEGWYGNQSNFSIISTLNGLEALNSIIQNTTVGSVLSSPQIAVNPNSHYRLSFDMVNQLGGEVGLDLLVDGVSIYYKKIDVNGLQYIAFKTGTVAANLEIQLSRNSSTIGNGFLNSSHMNIILNNVQLDEMIRTFSAQSKADYYPLRHEVTLLS